MNIYYQNKQYHLYEIIANHVMYFEKKFFLKELRNVRIYDDIKMI